MMEKTEPVFSSSEDVRNMQRQNEGNPLGVTSLVLSIVAVSISAGGALFEPNPGFSEGPEQALRSW